MDEAPHVRRDPQHVVSALTQPQNGAHERCPDPGRDPKAFSCRRAMTMERKWFPFWWSSLEESNGLGLLKQIVQASSCGSWRSDLFEFSANGQNSISITSVEYGLLPKSPPRSRCRREKHYCPYVANLKNLECQTVSRQEAPPGKLRLPFQHRTAGTWPSGPAAPKGKWSKPGAP